MSRAQRAIPVETGTQSAGYRPSLDAGFRRYDGNMAPRFLFFEVLERKETM